MCYTHGCGFVINILSLTTLFYFSTEITPDSQINKAGKISLITLMTFYSQFSAGNLVFSTVGWMLCIVVAIVT